MLIFIDSFYGFVDFLVCVVYAMHLIQGTSVHTRSHVACSRVMIHVCFLDVYQRTEGHSAPGRLAQGFIGWSATPTYTTPTFRVCIRVDYLFLTQSGVFERGEWEPPVR